MIWFHYLMVLVIADSCMTGLAEENSTLLPQTGCNLNITTAKLATVCKKRIVASEQFFENVLRLMLRPTTNTIELEVSVDSANKSRRFPEMKWPWASEIGRTLISLVAREKETIFTPIFTCVLTVGTEKLSVKVVDEPLGCLPSGDEGSDRIFDFLTDELSSLASNDRSEDAHEEFYKLCRAHKDDLQYTTFNCCRIIGHGNLPICADYSSIVLKFALPTIIGVFCISTLLIVPFAVEHIRSFPVTDFYKSSESPMSLSSVASIILLEDHGKFWSIVKRILLAALSYLAFFPDFFGLKLPLIVVFALWALFFCFGDLFKCNVEHKPKCERLPLDELVIANCTLPFSSHFKNELFSCFPTCSCCPTEEQSCGKLWDACKCVFRFLFYFILFLILFFVIFPIVTLLDLLAFFVCPCKCRLVREQGSSKFCYVPRIIATTFTDVLTFLNVTWFSGMIFLFGIDIVVGFSLNGEFFNPFIAPVVTLIAYFCKNWSYSVEAKFQQLHASIVKVCNEKANFGNNEHAAEERDAYIGNANTHLVEHPVDRLHFYSKLLWNSINEMWDSIKNLCHENICCSNTQDEVQVGEDIEHRNEPLGTINEGASTSPKKSSVIEIEKTIDPSQNANPKKIPADEGGENKQKDELEEGELVSRGKGKERRSKSLPTKLSGPSPSFLREHEIVFDGKDEAKIPKDLYKKILKLTLSVEEILFYFFRRLIFAFVYVFVMLSVTYLARESGISGSVQAITTIVAALIPFIFNTFWAETRIEQRNLKQHAIEYKLKKIITVTRREENKLFVKLNIVANSNAVAP